MQNPAEARIAMPAIPANTRAAAETHARLWAAAILLMGVCVAATSWFPLLTLTSLPSENYNEGWNAYRQWMTLQGQPLYGSHPALWTTNYPFLSFHIVGLLGGSLRNAGLLEAANANIVLAGRIVCFISLITTSLLAGLIIRTITSASAAALYAGFCLFAWLACYYGAGRAIDDPEMLSLAFTTFGLLAFLKARGASFFFGLSAIAFALALFTKHDLIAIPCSIGIHLLITRNWRSLTIFCSAGLIAACLLLALSFHMDGPYFFAALVQPRAYGLQNLIIETLHYLLHFGIPLIIGAAVLISDRTFPQRHFFLTLLILTHLTAIFFSGGDGVAANIFFAPLLANLLIFVIALCQLQRRPANSKSFEYALILATFYAALMVPFQLRTDLVAWSRLPAATIAAQHAVARLQTTPGPAICEDLLLCFNAGKPIDYDPYYVNDQIKIGRLQQGSFIAALNSHHYAAIQINGQINTAALARRKAGRFPKPFLSTLLLQYQPVLANRYYSVFIPK